MSIADASFEARYFQLVARTHTHPVEGKWALFSLMLSALSFVFL